MKLAAIKLNSPTSRSVRGVWECGARTLKPKSEIWTDRELIALGANTDVKYELWDGKIVVMPPAKPLHGMIIAHLTYLLGVHVFENKLGRLFDGQTGFRLGLEHCYEPDISFVSHRRIKVILPHGDLGGLFHGAPDLAVEVLSPSDSITRTERKVRHYLEHGSHLVWMVDPKSKTVRVYRPDGSMELLRGDRYLTGNSVVPGFRLSLGKLFEGI
jgi:Uma2 family endonuclease